MIRKDVKMSKAEEHIKILEKENKKLKDDIKKLEHDVMQELSNMSHAYEMRLAYVLVRYADGVLYDDEMEEWGKNKEFAIVATEDDRTKGRVWRVITEDETGAKVHRTTTKYS